MTYKHTMTPSKPRRPLILVDGSNVAYGSINSDIPRIEFIQKVIEELKLHNFRIVVIADANLKYIIDAKAEFEKMVRAGLIIQAPAGRTADDFLLQTALKKQTSGDEVYILTNDMFPVKQAQGVIRRIAFMIIPIEDENEYAFIPTLESLYETDTKGQKDITVAIPPVKEGPLRIRKSSTIDRELMDVFLNFLTTLQPPVVEGQLVAFTNIAGYLHNQFDGDFCKRFGYRRPKEFAVALEQGGYVELRYTGAPLYLKIMKKLMDETAQAEFETDETSVPESRQSMPVSSESKLLENILDLLKREMHYPIDFRINIKLNGIAPNRPFSTDSLIEKGLRKGLIEKQEMDKRTCYWPTNGRWDAVDPDDSTNPYPVELWNDFKESLHRLSNHKKNTQTRYHLAKHIGASRVTSIESLPLAKREHMVQLAVDLRILELVHTNWGPRYSVSIND